MHHHHHDHPRHSFGPHSRGGRGRHRARRGAVVEAVLLLLDERPMHGYELITELDDRSEGRWRPSAGTMYPALQRMEHRGLIAADEVDGKKQFSLTDDGRERLEAFRTERTDDAAPWSEHSAGGRGEIRRSVAEIVGQARQIGRFGTSEQIEAALSVFADTRQRLYAILAESGTDPTSDDDTSTAESSAETVAED
ncbi:MAG: PadR family transcriptional regulator [Actinomycetota bacterium]